MLDKELCEVAQINEFEQYLINRSDEVDDLIEKARNNEIAFCQLIAVKKELQTIRDKYYEQKALEKEKEEQLISDSILDYIFKDAIMEDTIG